MCKIITHTILWTMSVISLLLMIALTGCSANGFKVEGQVDGVPDRQVTITYMGDLGMVNQTISLGKGNTITYQGTSDEYTLLYVTDSQGQLIAQMVVRNGDKITFKSDGLQLPTLEVSGNEVTRGWMQLRRDNLEAFNSHDTQAIDRLVEQYIGRHPDQLLSTVLLVAEYNRLDDAQQVQTLLQRIQPDVRPQRLVGTLEQLFRPRAAAPKTLTTLTLYRMGKGVEELCTDGRPAALLFWTMNDKQRKACVDSLRSLSKRYAGKLLLADILVDADTAQWARTVNADGADWQHWWAPGGVMDPMLQGVSIERTPMIIVADSTARIVHVGNNPANLTAVAFN